MVFEKTKTFIRKRKKISTILGIVLVILLIITGRRVYERLNPPEYKTATVARKQLRQTLELSGEIRAQEEVALHFQASGKLAWIGVKDGDRVKAWAAVASQDKRSLEKQLKQDLIAFEKEYRDYQQAVEDNPLVNHEFKRILDKAQFDLDSEVIDVEIRNLAIELATLVSPIEGIVTKIDTPVAGVNVTAADTIQVVNPETLYFEAEVDEADIGLVRQGVKAVIVLDAYPDLEISSEVSSVDFSSSISEGGGTVFLIRHQLTVIEGVDYRLGLNGDVTLIIKEENDVLSLSLDAVDEDNRGSFVVVEENGNFVSKSITTGIESDDEVEVRSGLEEGDRVFLPGSLGDKVYIRDGR